MRSIKLKASAFGLVTAVAMATVMGCLPARAGQMAVDLTSPGETYSGSPYTLGFEFTANVDMSVTALGAFADTGSGLGNGGEVGLWDTSGDLLTSVTVPAGTAANLQGYFAYQSITPYMLTAGTEYIIGSYVQGDASSLDTDQGGTGSFNPDITVVADRYSDSTDSFAFPTQSDGFAGAWLGGNFIFTTASATVPEPGTLALLGLGLLGIVLSRRRPARLPSRG